MTDRAGTAAGISHLEVVPSWGRRLAGVEGLRGLAALTVLTYHSVHVLTPEENTGFYSIAVYLNQGLTLFFVLSGFLLFRPFAVSIIRSSAAPRLGSYFANRALRIFPAYIVVLLIVNYGLQTARLPRTTESSSVQFGVLSPADTVLNLFLLQNFSPSIRSGLEVAWTLGAEFCFYLALPLLYRLCLRVRRAGPGHPFLAVLVAPGVLLLVGAATHVWLDAITAGASASESYDAKWGNNPSSIVARSLLGQADLFALGMLAAIAYIALQSAGLTGRGLRRFRVVAGVAAILCLIAVTKYGPLSGQLAALASACLLLLAIIPNARGSESALGRVLDFAPLRFVGLVSYSLYLWHLAVIRWLAAHDLAQNTGPSPATLNLVIVIAISLALSATTYFLIEKQALKLKRRPVTAAPSGAG